MEKGGNGKTALIVIGSILTLGIVGYFVYKHYKKSDTPPQDKTPKDNKKQSAKTSKASKSDETVSLDIVNVNWDTKLVSFRVLLGSKTYMSEKVQWEKKNLGGEFGFVGSPLYTPSNQIEVVGANLPNGLVLVAKANGVNKSGRIIDFNSKTVKAYNGANMVGDISAAQETLKKVMTFGFFTGEESSNADSTPPPSNDFSNTQKWVSSIENGKEYCRWYDKNGKNTQTFNSPCSKSQANMYGNKAKK